MKNLELTYRFKNLHRGQMMANYSFRLRFDSKRPLYGIDLDNYNKNTTHKIMGCGSIHEDDNRCRIKGIRTRKNTKILIYGLRLHFDNFKPYLDIEHDLVCRNCGLRVGGCNRLSFKAIRNYMAGDKNIDTFKL